MRSKKRTKHNNLNLVIFFFAFVLFLVIGSFAIKSIVYIRDSKFDGTNNFIVAFVSRNSENVVSFSPANNSISMLRVGLKMDEKKLSKYLQIPIDGVLEVNQDVTDKNISSILFKSIFPFGNLVKNMNRFDCFRLFLLAKGVPSDSIYQRELGRNTTDIQKSTLISLTFTNPAIYRENQSIQIINAADTYGLGARLANLISNLGGTVVLISTGKVSHNSKIVYYGKKSYTVDKLSEFLKIPAIQTNSRGLADVIITIGEDKAGNPNF